MNKHASIKNMTGLILSLLIGVALLFSSSSISAQESAEELGERVFEAFRSEDVNVLNDLIPTLDELLTLMKDMGIEIPEEELEEAEDEFGLAVEEFFESYGYILEEGVELGIRWNAIRLTEVEIDEQVETEGEENEFTLTVYEIDILFTHEGSKYGIYIDTAFKIGEEVKLMMEEIEFSERE